jgi:diaminopimelate decarboxylase
MTAEQMADLLRGIIKRECAGYGLALPRICVEPGRAIVGPSMLTLYRVGTVKEIDLGSGHSRQYVSIDGGMSDNIRTALYDAEYTVRLASRVSTAQPVLSRVVGRHCESGDIVVRDCWLPADITAGDLLAVAATGAYCRAMASNYNYVPRPAVISVRDGQAQMVLRGETIDDLLRFDAGL